MLHDVIIWNGKVLTDKTFAERRKILESLFRDITFVSVMDIVERRDYGMLKNLSVYPAIQWKKGYKKVYDEYIKFDEVEGLVIKKLSALLKVGTRDCPIVTSMFKVRRPHKNYRF
jgi:ATP-dependent DNA ligase